MNGLYGASGNTDVAMGFSNGTFSVKVMGFKIWFPLMVVLAAYFFLYNRQHKSHLTKELNKSYDYVIGKYCDFCYDIFVSTNPCYTLYSVMRNALTLLYDLIWT